MADFSVLQHLLTSAGIGGREPVRFLLVSTHAQQTTGYSKVSYNLVKELAKEPRIRLFHFGFQRFFHIADTYRPYPPGVEVYDPASEEQKPDVPKESGFGFSQLPDYVRKVKPHAILLYNDASVICNFLEKLDTMLTPEERTYKMIVYLDQVYKIQRPDLLKRIDTSAHTYFAFTTYWRDILKQQGITKPIHILRHGFDADMYKPMNRMDLRKKHGVTPNTFLLLNINRNTPRKRYDLLMTAFAELVARYPTKPICLLCVTDNGEHGGFPIHEIFVRELIKRNVVVEHHIHKLLLTKSALNYTDEVVNELYAMSDVGVTAAEGEGFGLCQFEAMGVGIPQVVPRVGGFLDFCTPDNSMSVAPEREYYLPYSYSQLGGCVELVSPADLCLAIEEYLLDSDLREEHGKRARETVLAYKWEKEVQELVEVLLSIDTRG
jgi:glycosyltransferase involved in cell wall biosynthesis